MNRRKFLASATAAATLPTAAEALKVPAKKRPNVLYVFGDQHRFVSLPGEPFSTVSAPNLDKFRRANFSLDQCFSNFPLCVPYRTILMTGRYPTESGVVNNATWMKPSEFTLTKAFKASGYRVGYVGKYHLFQPDDTTAVFIPPGPKRLEIDDWHIWDNTNDKYHCWTYDEKGNRVVATKWAPTNQADQAIDLIQAGAKAENPWFVVVSWNPPHPAYNPPASDRDANPIPGLKDRPNVQLNPESKTPFLHKEPNYHTAAQGYAGGITGIDIEFGRLLQALEDTGQADNTIVIYTSDHGDMLGSHGKTGKIYPFEESAHVPFLVRYPGVTPTASSSKELFAAIDIYPTVCGLAGIPVPKSCSGRDQSALLRGRKLTNPKDTVFLMAGAGGAEDRRSFGSAGGEENGDQPPHYRGLHTAQYTYAVTQQGRWLFFDNLADPYQLKNLIDDPTHHPLMQTFDKQLRQHSQATNDTFQYPTLA